MLPNCKKDLGQHSIKDTYVLGSHKYKVMKWKKKLVFQLQDNVAGVLEQQYFYSPNSQSKRGNEAGHKILIKERIEKGLSP